MDAYLDSINNELEYKDIVCVNDLIYSTFKKTDKNIIEDIKIYYNNKNEYSTEYIGKDSVNKLYIKTKTSNINKIVSVSTALTELSKYKAEIDSTNINYNVFPLKSINRMNMLNKINDRAELMVKNGESKENVSKVIELFNSILSENTSEEDSLKMINHIGDYFMKEKKYNNLFLRGQSRVQFKLSSKVFRSKSHFNNESNMYNELMSKNPKEFDSSKTHLDILQQMQHYGLPTRLLDVSTNISIALYFACSQDKSYDGEVIVFAPDAKFVKDFNSDTIELLCATAFINHETKANLLKSLIRYKSDNNREFFNADPSSRRIVHEIRKMVGSFDCDINPEDLVGEFFVMPARRSERIIKQDGAFIISGLSYDLENYQYEEVLDSNVKHNAKHRLKQNGILQHFIIPSYAKEKIINELNLMGVNLSTLFPEIEHVSSHITSKYSKRFK